MAFKYVSIYALEQLTKQIDILAKVAQFGDP